MAVIGLIVSIVVGYVGLYIFRSFLSTKDKLPLPPGPPPKPFIGNIRDLPPAGEKSWEHWIKHKDLYGPISSVTVFGQTIIIINSLQLAVELTEKRSATYSDRPLSTFTRMAGWGDIVPVVRYSDRLRRFRKAFHQQIGSNASVARFNNIMDTEVRRFLLRAIDRPDQLEHHIRTEAGAVILKMGYGYTVEPHKNDPLVDLADKAMADFSAVVMPGTWIVDFLPFLRHLPAWVPGFSFNKMAGRFRKTVTAFSDVPYEFTKQQMEKKIAEPSFLSRLLGSAGYLEPGSDDETIVKWSAASFYGGGADTTVSSMLCFFLAMALYPDVQRKAQEEIDHVVGTDRLPGYEDRESLPYINALVKEVLRWHPVVPLNGRRSMAEDILEGYRIPEGAIILSNVWGMLHDPEIYPDPKAFKPERFLSSENHAPERDPHLISFGFGRRVCPGRQLADSKVYNSVAKSIAALKITKPVRDGKEIDIQADFLDGGAISHPAPFEVDIKPRSPGHEQLIRAVEIDCPWEKSNAVDLGSFEY